MRVGFNAQLLSYRHGYRSAGISRYIDHLVANLEPQLKGSGSLAFVGSEVPKSVDALKWLTTCRTLLPTHRPIVRILWEQLLLPIELRRHKVDVVHCPAYSTPVAGSVPSVVTFHDLSFLRLPAAFNRSNRTYLTTISRLAAAKATRFLAVSEATRRDMIELLGIHPDRIDVAYNGVDPQFRQIDDLGSVQDFRASKGLPETFIFYLGTLEPRKNVPQLIRAYALARHRGVVAPLVLAGGAGWGDLGLRALIDELGLESSVRLAGFISMDEQVMWYNAATLFAFPSRYEGFGLPVLEAMACGTPVIASNRSSLPEVVGDAGITVDPDLPEALADAMVTILHDGDARADLRSRGVARARTFTWERSAQETYDAFHRALATHPAGTPPR